MGRPYVKLKKAFSVGLLVLGVAGLSGGVALIYPPAGLICLGVLLLLGGLFAVEVDS